MWMLLREAMKSLTCLLLLVMVQSLAIAEEQPNSLGWANGSYPRFCQIYGLGKPLPDGLLRYEHVVNGNIVEVTVVDGTTIMTIGILAEDGSLDRSANRLHRIVPNRDLRKWSGTKSETQLELVKWIGRSHLPFEAVFGSGELFMIEPRIYFHDILGEKYMVVVNSREVVRNIQWFNPSAPQWVSLKDKSNGTSIQEKND